MIRATAFALSAAALLLATNAYSQRRPVDLTVPQVAPADVICFALYTVHANTLKLTAQLYPLSEDAPRTVRLEVERDGAWVEVARTEVIERGWTAPFRVEEWDDGRAWRYRVAHGDEATYEGVVRKNPVDDKLLVYGVFGDHGPR